MSNPETQPCRVKKKQQNHLLIAVGVVILIGWAVYGLVSSQTHSSSKRSAPGEKIEIANPLAHIDSASLLIEHAQNQLSKTEKTTADLQQQLQLLAQQKSTEEQTNHTQGEMLQTLQAQLQALQEKMDLTHPNKPSVSPSTSLPDQTQSNPTASFSPAKQQLPGVNDDVLALSPHPIVTPSPVIEPSKTPATYVPSGTFVRAVMLGGADASAGVNSQGNPTPVLFRLVDNGVLPNHHHSHLKDCVTTAAAIGDISSERGLMRLERLSCVSPNHQEVIEMPVEGTVFGPEGKNGVRGVPLWREGALLKRAFIAGTLSGFSQGVSSQYTTTSVSPSGTVNSINPADVFKYGAAQGVSNSMDKLADYNIRRADQYHPVVQLSAGTVVDIVFLKGFYLDGQKHDNEKESVLPPFDSVIPIHLPASSPESTALTPAISATPSPVLPVSPLPLTPAQINALQASRPQNQAVDFFKS